MNLKLFFISLVFVSSENKCFSQFTFVQATSYIHMPYDSLDEILNKKGYLFFETTNLPEDGTSSCWKNSKNFRIAIMSSPDTIQIKRENFRVGYANVIKKSIVLVFSGTNYYAIFAKGIKEKLQKLQSWTEDKSIITTYKNNRYFAKISKEVHNSESIFFIRIDDLAYELVDEHYE